jgi:hypothetical protein
LPPVFSRLEEGAGRLAHAGRKARGVARLEIERVDLVKGVPLFPFALENELFAVGREVSFSAALAFEDQLTRVGDETGLGGFLGLGRQRGDTKEWDQSQHRGEKLAVVSDLGKFVRIGQNLDVGREVHF